MCPVEYRYLGSAGELRVKSEFLDRGWNVASAKVDFGDDIFAIRDSDAELSRIQVKTANVEGREYGYAAQFRVGKNQLHTFLEPPLDYVFTARHESGWSPYVVIPQVELDELVRSDGLGSDTETAYILAFRYHRGEEGIEKILCSDSDLTEYKNDFSHWERIDHS